MHKKYDLKGSTVDREASEKERGKSLPTLKVIFLSLYFTFHNSILQDNDFIADGLKICIGDEGKDVSPSFFHKNMRHLAPRLCLTLSPRTSSSWRG